MSRTWAPAASEKAGEPFAMAGIYTRGCDHQIGEAQNTVMNFAILTTTANDIKCWYMEPSS